MDNISVRHSNEDTTTSMYLSFDAESTMSTACYKTLEAISDTSDLSVIDIDDSVNRNQTKDNYLNNTLEVHNKDNNKSPLKTVRRIEMPDAKPNTPLRSYPKYILMEYKALCSTPSKEQLLKTVDVNRGSDANRCVDIGLAFLGVDDERPAYFPLPPEEQNQENKENVLPDAEDVSSLSTCSSVEITSVEKKTLSSISIVSSITEEETVRELEIIKNTGKCEIPAYNIHKITEFSVDDAVKDVEAKSTNIESKEEYPKTTYKAKIEESSYMGHSKEFLEIQEETLTKELKNKLPLKPKIAVFGRNGQRSICEPNLQTNKPKFFNSDKRQSLLPKMKKSVPNIDAEIEIPLLMSKMLKITNSSATKEKDVVTGKEVTKRQNSGKKRSVVPIKTRSSLLASAPGNKRTFNFTQRMSMVVKTTLNSPARKIGRKSVMGGSTMSQQESVNSKKTACNGNSNMKKTEISPITFYNNKTTQAETKIINPIQETSARNTGILRKSLHPSAKILENSKLNELSSLSHNNLYICNVCKEKFRIKSLLDAHKRSHESDNITPAFVKKPSNKAKTASVAILGNSNQCKYCDKKFALLKALHIHLLQNCLKIPPSEKRKLQYTDLNHVEKAQLPNVFPHHNVQISASNIVSSKNYTSRYTLKQTIIGIPKSLSESLKDIGEMASNLETKVDKSYATSDTAVKKVKKITAHSGVYKTPSKSVPCHLCKLTFKSILDYTNHNLITHGNHKAFLGDDTGKTVGEKNFTTNNA